MKYIDAEKLKAEITKERQFIEGLFTEGDGNFYDGQDDAYNHILALIDSLQQEQPDVDLEEAAEKYDEAESWRWEAPKYPRREAFEAGAEWQKEQIVRDGLEGEVCGRVKDHINVRFPDGLCKYLEPKNISHIPADVTKYKVGDKVRVIIVKEEEK